MLNQVTSLDAILEATDCLPPLGDAMVQTCTTMAIYTITLVHKVRTRSDLLPAWWFATYYGGDPTTLNGNLSLTSFQFSIQQ